MHRQSDTNGFVLVATLWVLVAMTLFVSYFSVLVTNSQEDAFVARTQMQAKLDAQATLATIVYLASTRPRSYSGINLDDSSGAIKNQTNVLRLDGRKYEGLGKSQFSLQDAGSLISLRGSQFVRLKKILKKLGVSSSQQNRLVGNLRDYIDRDVLISLDGAEESYYRAVGMGVPTNRFLVSPMQVLSILKWDDYLDEQELRTLMSEVTIYVANRENYNSMTIKGMETVGIEGIEKSGIDQIIAHRQVASFSRLSEVNLLTGSLIPADPLSSPLFPSKYLRVSIELPGRNLVEWVGITMTPDSRFDPWQIDYRFNVNASYTQLNKHDANKDVENPATSFFN